jgi:hypothetical protein
MKTILAALGALLLVAAARPLPAAAGTVFSFGVGPVRPHCGRPLPYYGYPLGGYGTPFAYGAYPYYAPYPVYPPPPSFGFGRGIYYGRTFEGRGGSVRGYTFPGRSSWYEVEPR